MTHTGRCAGAKGPKSHCQCSCSGRGHGTQRESGRTFSHSRKLTRNDRRSGSSQLAQGILKAGILGGASISAPVLGQTLLTIEYIQIGTKLYQAAKSEGLEGIIEASTYIAKEKLIGSLADEVSSHAVGSLLNKLEDSGFISESAAKLDIPQPELKSIMEGSITSAVAEGLQSLGEITIEGMKQ